MTELKTGDFWANCEKNEEKIQWEQDFQTWAKIRYVLFVITEISWNQNLKYALKIYILFILNFGHKNCLFFYEKKFVKLIPFISRVFFFGFFPWSQFPEFFRSWIRKIYLLIILGLVIFIFLWIFLQIFVEEIGQHL